MKAIEVKKLEKTYANGVHALKGIDFSVNEGGFFGLLGANGAGKTTMISILTGTVNKSGGKAGIFNIDIDKDHAAAKRLIGTVPQEFNFNIFEKVLDIVVQQAGYFGITRKEATLNAEEILEVLGLWDKRDQPGRSLSGGMKRRLMIARALVHKPRLLILDEPTAGVDTELRHGMWKYLKRLNEKGTTILLTSHYLEEIEELCRNVAMIKDGNIVLNDTIKNVLGSSALQTYIVNVDKVKKVSFDPFECMIVDDVTLEVEITLTKTLNDFIGVLNKHHMLLRDLRPKNNRLEELFLNILHD